MFKRRVPQGADDGEFLNQVTQFAQKEKLAINDFHHEKAEVKNGYAEMQVSVHGVGSFNSICAFIDGLNKLARLSKVKDLTLSAEDTAAEYPMTATLVIYFALTGDDAEPVQEAPVADTRNKQAAGLTRGKAVLIGVLAIVLDWRAVLAVQRRESDFGSARRGCSAPPSCCGRRQAGAGNASSEKQSARKQARGPGSLDR